jgi:hypothetical protein
MVWVCRMVSSKTDTTQYAMRKIVLDAAFYCQMLPGKNRKSPVVTRLFDVFLLDAARRCQTLNHSHSIVAGGLPEIS